MYKAEFISKSEKFTFDLGVAIGTLCIPGTVVALDGDLGVGKTHLSKGIAKGLGVTDIIDSPTFTLIKEHAGRMMLYHIDVYRLSEGDDLLFLEEYLYSDGVTVIEWAAKVNSLLPKDALKIGISLREDGYRLIKASCAHPILKDIMMELQS